MLERPVDFRIMSYYEPMLPLLQSQSYIDQAGFLPQWVRTHSGYGDQPWKPLNVPDSYRHVWHLGYKAHPGITAPDMSLVEFIAFQQRIQLQQPVVPFIEVEEAQGLSHQVPFQAGQFEDVVREQNLVAYAFNDQYKQQKDLFFRQLWLETREDGLEFFDLTAVSFKEAAWVLKNSLAFVGDRSACWVLATGIGKKTVTFEPHPGRHKAGRLGKIFGCPYGDEIALPFALPVSECARVARSVLLKMRENKPAEVNYVRECAW